MDEFIQNTEQVLEYLEQKKACSTIISAARNCFLQLKIYLEEKDVPYTQDESREWLSAVSGKYGKGTVSIFRTTLNRLEDVYTYGEVRSSSRFKSDGTYFSHLSETLKIQLEDYVSGISDGEKSIRTIRNYKGEVIRIFHFL